MRSASGRVWGQSGSSSTGVGRSRRPPSPSRTREPRDGSDPGTGQEPVDRLEAVPPHGDSSHTLPIGKLMGIPRQSRLGLKANGITTCGQLLEVADTPERQAQLARASGITVEELTAVIDRADMARVNGIGWVFGMMLESLGVRNVAALARREPDELHALLLRQNREHRLARRSPTPEEVTGWVAQARGLEGGGRSRQSPAGARPRRRRGARG